MEKDRGEGKRGVLIFKPYKEEAKKASSPKKAAPKKVEAAPKKVEAVAPSTGKLVFKTTTCKSKPTTRRNFVIGK